MTKLSIVMPCYNEEKTIHEIVKRVLAVPLVDIEKELLIVDDGSKDTTHEKLKEIEAMYAGQVRVFIQEVNQGKGAALRKGIKESTGDYVVVQDADLEYDPNDYLKLLAPLNKGVADVVYGSRFRGDEQRILYFWHRMGNWLLTVASNMFSQLSPNLLLNGSFEPL